MRTIRGACRTRGNERDKAVMGNSNSDPASGTAPLPQCGAVIPELAAKSAIARDFQNAVISLGEHPHRPR